MPRQRAKLTLERAERILASRSKSNISYQRRNRERYATLYLPIEKYEKVRGIINTISAEFTLKDYIDYLIGVELVKNENLKKRSR